MLFDFDKYLNLIKLRKLFSWLKVFIKIDPYGNWTSVLFIFLIINIIFATYLSLEFLKISSDNILTSEEEMDFRSDTINRSSLEKIISVFETKNINYEDLKNNRIHFIDPSI